MFYTKVDFRSNQNQTFNDPIRLLFADVTLTPAPGMVYKTIGGVLDMYVFLGPEPNSVIEQYTKSIGSFYLVPYWSLGFQLCRYGYNHIDVVKDTVARMDAYQIPYVSFNAGQSLNN